MDSPFLAIAGTVVLVAVVIDVFWTITPHGPTPGLIVNRMTRRIWRGLLALHHRRPIHGTLTVAGVALLAGTALSWALLLWGGWTLVFAASEDAVVAATTGTPADFAERIYFASTLTFTTGTGDFVAGPAWRLVAGVASLTGLGIITLSVSYLVPVISAATMRRRVVRTIRLLGSTPDEIKAAARVGPRWQLTQVTPSIADDLNAVAEAHLAYPVLHYLHSRHPGASLSLRVATLLEAVQAMLASAEVDELERQRLAIVLRAIDDLTHTLLTEPDPARGVDAGDRLDDELGDRVVAFIRQEGWAVERAPR